MINTSAMIDKFGHQSYESVLAETLDAFIVDLSTCVTYIDPEYQQCLRPAPMGVYVNGAIEPSLVFDGRRYYTEQQLHDSQEKQTRHPGITDFNSFLSTEGVIYDQYRRPVFYASREVKRRCSQSPMFNHAAVHVAFIAIYDYFNRLSQVVKPWTDVDPAWLRLETFVKEPFLQRPVFKITQGDDVYIEAGDASFYPERNPLISTAIDSIHRFVGRYKDNFYRLRLNNTTLLIERGHDARTIDYHRLISQHMASIQHEDSRHPYRF